MAAAALTVRPRIGRVDTWEALVFRRERVRSGSGGITILDGPRGVGKSTFLADLLSDSRSAGFRIFRARVSTENPPPFALIREAVTSDRLEQTEEAPRGEEGAGPSLAFLPGLVREEPAPLSGQALQAAAEGSTAEIESRRYRLSAELAHPLMSAATKKPVLIALDDLHRADEASIEFLQWLQPLIASRPVWVVGTLDSSEPRPVNGPLEALLRVPEIERLRLQGLSEAELEEYLRWLVPRRRFREADLRRLYSETGGVPMFVERLLQQPSSVEASTAGAGAAAHDEGPNLGELDAQERRLLNLAVVAGGEFSFDVLAAAAGGEEEQVVEGVEHLVSLGILRELEWDRFAFTQEALRHRLFAELNAPTVRNLHRRIAAALERRGPKDMEKVYALARHSFLGGLDSAVQYNRQAAEYASSTFQPGLAIAYLERALDALRTSDPDNTEAEISLRLDLATQRARGGELQVAEAALRGFREDRRLWGAATSLDKAYYTILQARLMADQGRWEEAERVFQDVSPIGPSTGSASLRIATLRLKGEILFNRGNYEEALGTHNQALDLAQAAGDVREAAAEAIRRATVLSMMPGRAEEARTGFQAAVEKLVEVGDRSEAAFGLICLGAQLNQEGKIAEAREALQRAFELSEAAHDVRRLAWTCLNLADLELEQGRLDEAGARARVAVSLFDQIGDLQGRARAHLTEGRLAIQKEEYDAAATSIKEARRIFAVQGLEADQLEVDLRDAELREARGDRPGALKAAEALRARELERLRPDLVADWRRLRERLVAG